MKYLKYIIAGFFYLSQMQINAQTDNYVYVKKYQEATTNSSGTFQDETSSIQQVTYFDGLGRPNQSVGINQSATQNDVVNHFEYDDYGRMTKEYLPYTTNSGSVGSFRVNAKTATENFYNVAKYDNTTNPYSEKEFDNSPLNIVKKQAAPGASWAMGSGHEVETNYLTNTNADNVRQYAVSLSFANGIYTPSLTIRTGNSNLYDQGELIKTVVKDENHPGTSTKKFTKEEYVDKQGRVVLSRTFADYPVTEVAEEDNPAEALGFQGNGTDALIGGNNQTLPHDTYYVYDDFGNLSFILSPEMDAGSNSLATINTNINALGYRYVYDKKNRLVEKQIAGKAVEYIVYNKLDQPIMTQDGNQRQSNKWSFTKYDVFGRVAYTGIASDSRTRNQIQTTVDNLTGNQWVSRMNNSNEIGGADIYYNNEAFPIANIAEVYTISYYDNYNFDLAGSDVNITAYGKENTLNLKGLATGSKVKVLDANELDKWITTVDYYDEKGRIIYTYTNNEYLVTIDIVEVELDFLGKPKNSSTRHIKNGTTITTLSNYTYDHAGRLLSHTQCIGDGLLCYECTKPSESGSSTTDIDKELIVFNTYDELGQLESKKVGGLANATVSTSLGLQTVDYTYNIRNWLTSINDSDISTDALTLNSNDLFGFKVSYDNPTGGTALFDGNISESLWQTQNTDNNAKKYTYAYDALSRVTAATDNTGNYNVSNIKYDKNGNITRLNRSGWQNSTDYADMDDLEYTYAGNELTGVKDNGSDNFGFINKTEVSNEYTYDVNGNLKTDLNKGITNVDYSHRNLPTEVSIDNGKIKYVYDATGIKQRKTVSTGTTTDYAGNYVYENDELKFFNQPEGYIEPENDDYKYVYQYKDNLGNVRLSYSDTDKNGLIDANTELVEENNYYPFGMKHKGYNETINGEENNFKYNGKEIDDELGLDWYHYGFRMYDPATARFTGIDPISDQFAFVSTYNYAENSPVRFIDLHGLQKAEPESFTGALKTIGSQLWEAAGSFKKIWNIEYDSEMPAGYNAGVKLIQGGFLYTAGAATVVTAGGGFATTATSGSILSQAFAVNSIKTIGINATADGFVQFFGMDHNKSYTEQYDITGLVGSILSNPLVGQSFDAILDISGENLTNEEKSIFNDSKTTIVNTFIGVLGGKAGSQISDFIAKNPDAKVIDDLYNFISNIIINSTKTMANECLEECDTD